MTNKETPEPQNVDLYDLKQTIHLDFSVNAENCTDDDMMAIQEGIDYAVDYLNGTGLLPYIKQELPPIDVEAITSIAWEVFFSSNKPAPYNQMKDVILHLTSAGYFRAPLTKIEGLNSEAIRSVEYSYNNGYSVAEEAIDPVIEAARAYLAMQGGGCNVTLPNKTQVYFSFQFMNNSTGLSGFGSATGSIKSWPPKYEDMTALRQSIIKGNPKLGSVIILNVIQLADNEEISDSEV